MPGKKKLGKFWNEKARTQLLSGIVVALLTLTAITGFFVALSVGVTASGVDTAGLAVEWDFRSGGDGINISDSSGNGHDGEIVGSGYTWNTDFLELSSNACVNATSTPQPLQNGTVCLWVKVTQLGSSGTHLWNWNLAGSNEGDTFIAVLSNWTLVARYDNGDGTSSSAYAGTISDDTYYFVTFVKDYDTLKIYLDGSLVDTSAVSSSAVFGNYGAFFTLNDIDSSYAGTIDVKYFDYWNRSLNDSEVQQHYTEITSNASDTDYTSFSFGEPAFLLDTQQDTGVPGASQGFATDGQYLYCSFGGSAGSQYAHIVKYALDGNILKNVYMTDFTEFVSSGCISIGDIAYYNGSIYVVGDFESSGTGGWIFVLDTNLNLTDAVNISSYRPSGAAAPGAIGYHDASLWVVWDTQTDGQGGWVSKFDMSVSFVKTYNLTYTISSGWHYQGIAWYGDYAFLPIHESASPEDADVYFYDAVNDTFVPVQRISLPVAGGYSYPLTQGTEIYLRNDSVPYIALMSRGASSTYDNRTVWEMQLNVSGNMTGTIDNVHLGDNVPPTVSITSPTEGATVNGTVSITGTASDSDGTVQSVEVKIDSGTWQTATGTTSWSYSWDSTGVSDGTHTIYARSYDGTDYSTEDSVTVTVNNTAAPTNHAPTITLNSPGNGSTDVNVNASISVTVSDPDGDLITITFWNWTGSEWISWGQLTNKPNGTYSFNPPGDFAYNTTYTWRASVSDGNATSNSETWTFTTAPQNTTPNQPPTAAFTYSINNLTVTFTDGSTDSDGTIASWNWSFGDGQYSTAQNPQHTYSSYGTYSVNLTVTDNDGATDTVSESITLATGGGDTVSSDINTWYLIIGIMAFAIVAMMMVVFAGKRR